MEDIIRMRIKQKLPVRVCRSLSENSRTTGLFCFLRCRQLQRRQRCSAPHPHRKGYATSWTQNIDSLCNDSCGFNFEILSEKWEHSSSLLCSHCVFIFCIYALMPACVCSILVATHTFECNYACMGACMQRVTGQWGIEFG